MPRQFQSRTRPPLIVRDRYQRELGERPIGDRQIGQVQAPMLSSQRAGGNLPKQRKVQIVDVEMDDVELRGAPAHAVEHDHVVGQRIPHGGIEPERSFRARHQFRRGQGVAARK